MPEVEHTCTVSAPLSAVWDFVKLVDNWAPHVRGYQKHEALSDTDSEWTVKGDIGILARSVRLKVHVTEWVEQDRVTFTITGLTESVSGEGTFSAVRTALAEPVQLSEDVESGEFATQLTFRLKLNAAGVTGPFVNALLKPLLKPAAHDLATKIAARVEEMEAVRSSAQFQMGGKAS